MGNQIQPQTHSFKLSSTKMITIVASHNVTPNQPTPKGPIWLSDSDQIGNLHHVLTIYVYKSKYNTTIEKMKNSLSKILVLYYPVAGRLRLTESGRLELDCKAKGVTLLEAESTATFDDYGDFAPSESTKELVPKVDYTLPTEEMPLLLVQLTTFRGGEGLVIGVACSHPLADGISAIHFINQWAKLVRGEELEPNETPFLDRTLLKFPQPSEPCIDLPEWKPVRLVSNNNGTKQKKRSAALLKLSSIQVEKLKKKANDQPSKEGAIYSRFEAIAAHIWRCASEARESDENQPTRVMFSVDIRNRLNPPLPRNFFGNALAKTVTPKCNVRDIISNPLSYGAQKIREAVHAVTYDFIRSHLSVVLGQEQLESIRDFFTGQAHIVRVPYSGNDNNVLFSSWMSMPVYEADFGWGKPMHFGVASLFPEDRAHIILSPDGDGILVNMNFLTERMQLFKKLFYEGI